MQRCRARARTRACDNARASRARARVAMRIARNGGRETEMENGKLIDQMEAVAGPGPGPDAGGWRPGRLAIIAWSNGNKPMKTTYSQPKYWQNNY